MNQETILHQADQQKFVLSIAGHDAVLEYQQQGDRVDFTRTFVPDPLRGQGVAGRLVRYGLEWAKSQQLTISASCWYVQKFL
ncbi:GNAT family N-acetyltransferase [Shewanella marisflavi]|uniref:GNAT family N-acetyltransferase n=1 Tax=Shewanella marisflavi TaxID=260364 RepID=UPI003AAE1818